MSPPEVPDLPAEWPPTAAQLAAIATTVHWELADLAYELPRGNVDRQRLDKTASVLEQFASLLAQHDVPDTKRLEDPTTRDADC